MRSEDSETAEQVRALALHSPEVAKWLALRRVHKLGWSETMEHLVLDLANQNKSLKDQLVRMHQKHGSEWQLPDLGTLEEQLRQLQKL